jgi:alpha-L-arabinofuranosidase
MKRRDFLKNSARIAGGLIAAADLKAVAQIQAESAASSGGQILIDPKPLFDISPHLYMQFMEPLGTTDPSVEAAWDYNLEVWRNDFVETTADLAPGMLRFGGLFSRYYKWREGIGHRDKRPWMRNYVWGGKETNRIGTHEFVYLCRRVGAEPMYCVNFLSDGEKRYATMPEGNRTGDAHEAADWVSYANDPGNNKRKTNGHPAPFNLKYWQLGNETSYGNRCFKKDEAIAATIEFAKAMRERDRSLKLIGWGDSGWAGDLVVRAGDQIDYVAIHMMGQTPVRKDTVLSGCKYQAEPERAWDELLEIFQPRIEQKLLALEETLANRNSNLPIAITEGHLSLAPNNSNPILTEWLTGVYHARVMNLYQRHGGRVKIATTADFNGTRWTTNALIHQVPSGISYLLPAGAAARLFKRYNGTHGISVKSAPAALDIAASRTGDTIFLHVANLNFEGPVEATFAVKEMVATTGTIFEIAPENPRQEISPLNPDVFKPIERTFSESDVLKHRFPARSVSVIELACHPA